MRFVLNSAVVSRPGFYEYKLLTELEAEGWLKRGGFTSRVGYEATAQFIEDRFGGRCPLSREPITMEAGDEALVVRLKYRALPDPRQGWWVLAKSAGLERRPSPSTTG